MTSGRDMRYRILYHWIFSWTCVKEILRKPMFYPFWIATAFRQISSTAFYWRHNFGGNYGNISLFTGKESRFTFLNLKACKKRQIFGELQYSITRNILFIIERPDCVLSPQVNFFDSWLDKISPILVIKKGTPSPLNNYIFRPTDGWTSSLTAGA